MSGRRCRRSAAGLLLSALAAALLCACANIAPGGRAQLTAPTAISSVYSSLDMNLHLAAATPIAGACAGVQCRLDKGFELQISRLGARLAQAAYDADPTLKERVPAFTFIVAEKSEAGSASDAQGNVVIYRGVRTAGLNEESLAFLIAMEMGHVIARHHDEKSATGLLLSLVAQVVMPWTNLPAGLAALAGSLASAVGTQVITADKDVEHTLEAETIAHGILAQQGWSKSEIAMSLARYSDGLGDNPWAQTVRESLARLEHDRPIAILVAMNQQGSLSNSGMTP